MLVYILCKFFFVFFVSFVVIIPPYNLKDALLAVDQTRSFMKPRFILTGLAIVCGLYLSARAIPNLWGLLIDAAYFIPKGSSVFTFRSTLMNPGSGDWWLYGEDNRYYYYFEDDIKLSKQTSKTCQGFLKDDVTTWCKDE